VVRRFVDDEEVRAGRDDQGQGEAPAFAAREREHGLLVLGPAGEEEAAEELLRVRALQARCALDALQHGSARVELHLLLGEIRRDDTVAEAYEAVVGIAPLEDCLEQRCLSRSVRTDECDMLAALDRKARILQQHPVADPKRKSIGLEDGATAASRLQELEAEASRPAREQIDFTLRLCAFLLQALDLGQLHLSLPRHLLGRSTESGHEALQALDVPADSLGRLRRRLKA
jgi:hypothetical protein